MTKHCVVVDYGSGNVRSVTRALEHVAPADYQVSLSDDPHDIAHADQLVLPGVGAFGNCYQELHAKSGMAEALTRFLEQQRPFLGICVGMQMMADQGLEHQGSPGLGLIAGTVRRFSEHATAGLSIPHIGWTPLKVRQKHPVLADCNGQSVYFVHSFVYDTLETAHILAQSDYGETFCAVVGKDHLLGTQFHPEKSQAVGLRLLYNFLLWRP